nr:uncharacterized protein LOC105718315 isoform X2 [Aotus nancymaae]
MCKHLMPGSPGEQALMCPICQFPWCKDFHHGRITTTNLRSLNREFGREAGDQLSEASASLLQLTPEKDSKTGAPFSQSVSASGTIRSSNNWATSSFANWTKIFKGKRKEDYLLTKAVTGESGVSHISSISRPAHPNFWLYFLYGKIKQYSLNHLCSPQGWWSSKMATEEGRGWPLLPGLKPITGSGFVLHGHLLFSSPPHSLLNDTEPRLKDQPANAKPEGRGCKHRGSLSCL